MNPIIPILVIVPLASAFLSMILGRFAGSAQIPHCCCNAFLLVAVTTR
jgi:hypothetical protein